MNKPFPYIIREHRSITLLVDNVPYTVNSDQLKFSEILEAIKQGDWQTVRMLVSPKKVISNYLGTHFKVENGQIWYFQNRLHHSLEARLFKMFNEGFDIQPLVNFVQNLYENQSTKAISELFLFLQDNDLPITPDGCFLAYKRVNSRYFDCHTDRFANYPPSKIPESFVDYAPNYDAWIKRTVEGLEVNMMRTAVNSDREQVCSSGLHFCSLGYLSHFEPEIENKTVILKINPADVVSIPKDYDNSKGRCCKYVVIGEVARENEATTFKSVVYSGNALDV